MKKIIAIKQNESPREIEKLQTALKLLGFENIDSSEIEDQKIGPTTQKAVRTFQTNNRIRYDSNMIVDGATANKINELLDKKGLLVNNVYTIRGTVTFNDQPISGVSIQGFDQDLPSKRTPLEPLGEAVVTDEMGNYLINYTREQFANTEKRSADIVITVSKSNRKEIYRSNPLFNAGEDEVINIALTENPEINRLSEYETYIEEISPLLGEVSIAKLTREDITFIQKEAGIIELHLSQLNTAYVWASENKMQIDPQIFYALLRQNFTSRLENWLTKTIEEYTEALNKAVELNIASISNIENLDHQLELLMEFVILKTRSASNNDYQASIDEMLGIVIEDTGSRNSFLRKYRDKTDISTFWETLKEDADFSSKVPEIQLTFQLSKLTTNNLQLVKILQTGRKITDLKELIQFNSADWDILLEENDVSVPYHITGQDEAERKHNYSKSLITIIEKQFPTETIAHRVTLQKEISNEIVLRTWPLLDENISLRELDIDTLDFPDWDDAEVSAARTNLSRLQKEVLSFPDFEPILIDQINRGLSIQNPIRNEINKFLDSIDNFSFEKTPMDIYLSKLEEDSWEGIEYEDEVTAQLRRMQRMYNVGGDSEMMFSLLELGMHSANQISSIPLEHFVQITSDEIGVPKALASHAKASQISDSVVMVYQTIYEYGKYVTPAAIGSGKGPVEEIIKEIPSYDKLFGSFDICECGHCRSVYSATAYFVDLLHQVLGGKHIDTHPSFSKPFKELTLRRPDLQFIKLTCENTNTFIPYIDLVNEILETYVGFGVLSEATTRDTSEFTAKELAANPQYIIKEAYNKLKEEYFPISLPFDLSLETARVYLEHLGTELYEVMKVFYVDDSIESQTSLNIEQLKISEKEYEILTGKELNGSNLVVAHTVNQLFGYEDSTNIIPELEHVPTLLSRLEIDYTTLISLLKTSFVNPHFQIAQFLQDPDVLQAEKDIFKQQFPVLVLSAEQETILLVAPDDAQCDLTKTKILYADQSSLTEDEFLKIHRFVRIWKKLGLQVSETDLITMRLSDNLQGELSANLFGKIGLIKNLHNQLKVPYDVLLSFWGTINTLGEKSLYEKLFLNKAALKIDSGFILTPQRDELINNTLLIAEHIPTLIAALRINEKDLLQILNHLNLNPVTSFLSLANISKAYSYSAIAKAKRLKIEELLQIIELLDFDIFLTPESTQKFLTILEKIRNSEFKIKELQYLFKHKKETYDETTITEITSLSTDISTGLKKIENENLEIQNPTADDIQDKLGKIFDQNILQKTIGTIDNTFLYSYSLNTLPFNEFPGILNDKFSFNESEEMIKSKGFMTVLEQIQLKALSNDTNYTAAIDGLFEQPRLFYEETFYGFLDVNDIDVLFNEQVPPSGNAITISEERYQYFLLKLLPFLRKKLNHEWIKQSIAEYFEIDASTAVSLLEDILVSINNNNNKIIDDILALKTNGWDSTYFDDIALTSLKLKRIDAVIDFDWGLDSPDAINIPADNFSVRWEGKLSVPATEEYTFYLGCDDGIRMWINNELLINEWNDQPLTTHKTTLKLKAGEFYDIKIEYYESNAESTVSFQWSSATMVKQVVPTENIVPLSILETFLNAFLLLQKTSVIINKFKLDNAEISHFTANNQHFNGFDLNNLPIREQVNYNSQLFQQWLRLFDYTFLRKQWPISDEHNLLTVFRAASTNFLSVKNELLATSGWEESSLFVLLGDDFGQGMWQSTSDNFKNEIFLLKLQKCIDLSKKIGIAEDKLNMWSALNMNEDTAENIKNTIRAKYDEEVWPDISKNIHDILRGKQRNALVNYLLAQPDINQKNITTSNDLYQYFLIDVEMEPCMMTSRIVQANASIQLFVQRCLLNLEKNVSPDMINKNHWKWMKKYRVWEANRKVFLYPENWIEPELRDDKSPFFKELENALLQGEINERNIEKATINYLKQLDVVAQLDIRSVHHAGGEVHVFGRTYNTPYNYYYRKYKKTKVWTPWEKIQSDIEGDHITSVVWNNRLYLFWTSFTEKARRDPAKLISAEEPEKYFEVKLAWSEYHDGNWMPKQISTNFFETDPTDNPYKLNTKILTDNTLEIYLSDFNIRINDSPIPGQTSIPVLGYWWRDLGKFSFSGCNKPAMATKIYMNINEAHITTFNDGYNEIYSMGYASEEGNKDALLTNKLLEASLRTEENFPRFKSGKTFFLQERHKSYWVTSKPRIRKYSPVKPSFDIADIELPILVDQNPLDLWWEQPIQDVLSEVSLEWDSPVSFNDYRNEIYNSTIAQRKLILNNETRFKEVKVNNNENVAYEYMKSDDLEYTYSSSAIQDKYFSYIKSEKSLKFHNFYHHYVCSFVKSLNKDGIQGLFDISNQKYTDNASKFMDLGPSTYYVDTPYPKEHIDFDLQGAYSQYNWELFFHLPMLVANRLHQDQRFEEAQKWYHYVFNPTSSTNESSPKRFWNVLPFKTTPQESLQVLMDTLNLPDGNEKKEKLIDQIEQWRDDPFKPHLIARLRPIAYMKNVVMKYLDNLISWGDYLFRQDSIESINEATQLYILAAELLGEKPQKVPVRGKITPETYASLKPRLNEFSNAMVDIETYFPFYNEGSFTPPKNDSSTPLKTTAQTLYFCVPDNKNLLEYWDTVADRLFKIRHCQNIEGIERQLSLFEPPIDPALLVKAVAGGLDIGSVLGDLNAPLPHYRFSYMIQKALEMANELKSLGGMLLSTLEKKDAEKLSTIRAVQETEMLKLIKDIKKDQLSESRITYESLVKTRDTSVYRYLHNLKLLGEESPETPQIGTSITDVSLPSDKGSGEGDKKLLSYEKQDLSKSEEAAEDQKTASMWETLANVSYYIPEVQAEPWGIGVSFGGTHVGPALRAISAEYQRLSTKNNFEAAKASKLGSFHRREQDWVLQANLAAKEIMQIDKQIMAAEIRVQIADKELQNHEQQISNAQKIEEFLRDKYTNEELYGWMQGQISTLFFQSYKMAYDLAKKAEKTYRFENGLTSSNFIEFGYWDSFRKGLLSGEKLYLSLKRMEKDSLEKNKRDYEITKHIPISFISPEALLKLKETGICEFSIPELLFDLDFPGQYFRRVKSVSITIPCIVGPYTSVSAKLTLLKNRIRKNGNSQTAYVYTGLEDTNFVHDLVGIQSIATSQAQGDSGMFELNFRDERYLPFEGAGAISTWKLELPTEFHSFDYDSISDVILHINYTSRDGGDALKQKVNTHVNDTLNKWIDELSEDGSGLLRLMSMKQEFSGEWHRFFEPKAIGEDENEMNVHQLPFEVKPQHFPYFLRGKDLRLTNVKLMLKVNDSETISEVINMPVTLKIGKGESAGIINPLTDSGLQTSIIGLPMLSYDLDEDMFGWWQVEIDNADIPDELKIIQSNNSTSPMYLDQKKIEDMYLILNYIIE